jgi:tetratricopeptide (TPR) repeat protein
MNPSNPLLMQRLGDGFAILGQSDKASEYYLKVLERYPALPGLREKLVELFLRKEDRKHAAEQLEAIIRNNPTNPQYYYLLGSIAYEDKNPAKAVDYYNKALLLNPDFHPEKSAGKIQRHFRKRVLHGNGLYAHEGLHQCCRASHRGGSDRQRHGY